MGMGQGRSVTAEASHSDNNNLKLFWRKTYLEEEVGKEGREGERVS